jgi:hypothetical protein
MDTGRPLEGMAKDSSRNGLKNEQLAEGNRVFVLAEALRIVLAEVKEEVYAYAAEREISRDLVDEAFRTALKKMLGPRGWMH